MQTTSDEFLELVKGSTAPVFTADVWYDGELYYPDVPLEDGSVSFTSKQAVRGSVELTILDTDNTMVPNSLSSPLAPYGGYVNVRAGFDYQGTRETISMGWFDITEVEIEEAFKTYEQPDGTTTRVGAGARIIVSGVDFMQRILDYNFMNPDVAKVNNVSNLMTNGGFSTLGTDPWVIQYGTSGSGNFNTFSKYAFKGGVSGRGTWTGASTNSATGGAAYEMVAGTMAAGNTYTFSLVVRPSKTRTMAAKIQFLDISEMVLKTTTGTALVCPANQWTRLTVTSSSVANTQGAILSAVQTVAAVWAKGDTLDIDDGRLIVSNAPSQWTIWDEIQRLCYDIVICAAPDFDLPQVPVGIIYDGDRFDAINKLAKYAGCEPVMNSEGQLTLRKIIDGDLAPDIDYEVNLMSYSKRLTRNNVYNAVVARGKDACSLSINRFAYMRTGPLTFDGPMGRRPYFYESDLLDTNTAVQAIADGLLDDVTTALNQEIDVDVLPNPAIELGDFAKFSTENGSAQARVVGIKYPMQGAMTLTLALPNFWWAE